MLRRPTCSGELRTKNVKVEIRDNYLAKVLVGLG